MEDRAGLLIHEPPSPHDNKLEDDEEEFRSCCGDDDEIWKVTEEKVKEEGLDESSVKMYFKGVSIITESGESGIGYSGIGVVMERSKDEVALVQVQKKLDFYVDSSVADCLALMEGLIEVLKSEISHVYAYTDSTLLYSQITLEEKLEIPLILALRERIIELAGDLETFSLKLVPSCDLERPLRLAQVAIGIVALPAGGDDKSHENCSICREDKMSPMMITMKCSHKFCSHCVRTYVEDKMQSSQVPIRCPQPGCRYYISVSEGEAFLTRDSYERFMKAQAEASALLSGRICCPRANCSVLLDPRECLSSARGSSSSQLLDNNCAKCPACKRLFCVECWVPWHSSMSCEEYQNLPLVERDASDVTTLHHLARNIRSRRCQQCCRMTELTRDCYHMTCWCCHEFCYSCGYEYRDGQQTCQCAIREEDNNVDDSITRSVQVSEQWAWETFNTMPMLTDAYSDQERSQLALIQRFLSGGFSLSDHHPPQSPPRSTDSSSVDIMKDLQPFPWLERFMSVISDDYDEYSSFGER